MPLHPLIGHRQAKARIVRAHAAGRLPQTILIAGPAGVGKQRFALWVAQLLLCETGRGASRDEPCGTCAACRKVLNLAHPDLHWLVPIPRPKAGDSDKQVDEAAETLAAVMAERRESGRWGQSDGMAIHGVASARLLLRRAALTSVEGGAKVFVVGDAERLVPQESSPEAANALLKLIEEPPRNTVVLLTSAEPDRLLPTVRSRAIPLRLGRLSSAEVRDYLQREDGKAKGSALEDRVLAAAGAIGRVGEGGADAATARQAAQAVLSAATAGKRSWIEHALRQAPWQARGDFSEMLDALGILISERARSARGRSEGLAEARGRLSGCAEAMAAVEDAREAARGNVNPQLLLASLAGRLEEAMCP